MFGKSTYDPYWSNNRRSASETESSPASTVVTQSSWSSGSGRVSGSGAAAVNPLTQAQSRKDPASRERTIVHTDPTSERKHRLQLPLPRVPNMKTKTKSRVQHQQHVQVQHEDLPIDAVDYNLRRPIDGSSTGRNHAQSHPKAPVSMRNRMAERTNVKFPLQSQTEQELKGKEPHRYQAFRDEDTYSLSSSGDRYSWNPVLQTDLTKHTHAASGQDCKESNTSPKQPAEDSKVKEYVSFMSKLITSITPTDSSKPQQSSVPPDALNQIVNLLKKTKDVQKGSSTSNLAHGTHGAESYPNKSYGQRDSEWPSAYTNQQFDKGDVQQSEECWTPALYTQGNQSWPHSKKEAAAAGQQLPSAGTSKMSLQYSLKSSESKQVQKQLNSQQSPEYEQYKDHEKVALKPSMFSTKSHQMVSTDRTSISSHTGAQKSSGSDTIWRGNKVTASHKTGQKAAGDLTFDSTDPYEEYLYGTSTELEPSKFDSKKTSEASPSQPIYSQAMDTMDDTYDPRHLLQGGSANKYDPSHIRKQFSGLDKSQFAPDEEAGKSQYTMKYYKTAESDRLSKVYKDRSEIHPLDMSSHGLSEESYQDHSIAEKGPEQTRIGQQKRSELAVLHTYKKKTHTMPEDRSQVTVQEHHEQEYLETSRKQFSDTRQTESFNLMPQPDWAPGKESAHNWPLDSGQVTEFTQMPMRTHMEERSRSAGRQNEHDEERLHAKRKREFQEYPESKRAKKEESARKAPSRSRHSDSKKLQFKVKQRQSQPSLVNPQYNEMSNDEDEADFTEDLYKKPTRSIGGHAEDPREYMKKSSQPLDLHTHREKEHQTERKVWISYGKETQQQSDQNRSGLEEWKSCSLCDMTFGTKKVRLLSTRMFIFSIVICCFRIE